MHKNIFRENEFFANFLNRKLRRSESEKNKARKAETKSFHDNKQALHHHGTIQP